MISIYREYILFEQIRAVLTFLYSELNKVIAKPLIRRRAPPNFVKPPNMQGYRLGFMMNIWTEERDWDKIV